MPKSAKTPNSREAFAAIFEEQTRRFSAFDLLGLSQDALAPSQERQDPPPTRATPTRVELQAPESSPTQPQALRPDHQPQAPELDQRVWAFEKQQGAIQDLDAHPSHSEALTDDNTPLVKKTIEPLVHSGSEHKAEQPNLSGQTEALRPDRQSQVLLQDGQALGLTVSPKSLGMTVGKHFGLTPPELVPDPPLLVPDGQAEVTTSPVNAIVLAPVQWAVWLALKEAEKTGRVLTYRQIAKEIHATPEGVKKAVFTIQKEGGISKKEIIRTAREQGFLIKVNPEAQFRPGTLNEGKGVLKRGVSFGLTGGGKVQVLRHDGRSMYVCNINNSSIRQTDMAKLLRLAPPSWRIREQTLVQIAESLPEMTAIEFRLSLAYLIEQARKSKEPIRNPNAWIKAAFEKNGGPLVTEREIEARLEQTPLKRDMEKSRSLEEEALEELTLLRRYLAATPEDRAEIDRIAAEKAAPLLKIVADDKRAGVMEQARLEAARAYFAQKLAGVDSHS